MPPAAHPPTSRPPDPAPLAASVCVWAGAALLVGAPLIRGGNRGVALIALEWLALVVLLAVASLWAHGQRAAWGTGATRWGLLALAGSPLWVALLQLTPVPLDLWTSLPGRAFYQELQQGLGLAGPAWRPASLIPDATRMSVLAGLPVVACFALGLVCAKDRLPALFRLCIGAALLQAGLGLAQLGAFDALFFGAFFTGVIGTFANSNHFAGFLAMCLPLVWLELRRALRVYRMTGRGERMWWGWGAVLAVLLVAVVATRSRGGLGVAIAVSVCAWLLLPLDDEGRLSWSARLWLLAGLAVAALLVVAVQWVGVPGLTPTVRGVDARSSMFVETWTAARVFWPLGAGLGSFAGLYPRFQAAIPGREFVEHAHSDYVQLLMEVGVLGVLLGLLVLALLVAQGRRWARQLADGQGLRREHEAMLAAGLGLLTLLLHAWVDFNLRIPALAMLGAFLGGVCLRPGTVGALAARSPAAQDRHAFI